MRSRGNPDNDGSPVNVDRRICHDSSRVLIVLCLYMLVLHVNDVAKPQLMYTDRCVPCLYRFTYQPPLPAP